MTTRAIERVDDWETRSFGGGYRGLQELAERDFSGVVRSPAGTLCMLNGAVVGIVDGTIEGFEDADGTAYAAPTPALPLLIVMQDRAEEVRAKYYTEDTPLSKVDATLSDGGFTGFVELSENVLSGDYYVVYHGGRSMSVAFVGNSGQLLGAEEAFDRANDEVGIYKVRPVEIEPIEIPEPATAPAAGAADDGDPDDGSEPTDGTAAAGAQPTAPAADDPAASADEGIDGSETDTGTSTTADPAVERTDDEAGDTEDSEPEPGRTPADDRAVASGEEGPVTSGDDGDGSTDDGRSGSTAEETTAAEGTPTTEGTDDRADEEPSTDDEPATDEGASPRPVERTASTGGGTATRDREPTGGGASTAGRTAGDRDTEGAETTNEDGRQAAAGAASDTDSSEQAETGAETATEPTGPEPERTTDRRPASSADDPATETRTADDQSRDGTVGGAADLETRTIPSLDPERSWSENQDPPSAEDTPVPATQAAPPSKPEPPDDRRASAGGTEQSSPGEATAGEGDGTAREAPERSGGSDGATSTDSTSNDSPSPERVRELEETIADREERIETLETHLEDARAERDEITAERDEIVAERDELREEREDLRAQLAEARDRLADLEEERDALESQLEAVETDGVTGETRLTRREAMDGTDLFVRYDSKGEPTLKTAHDSGASQSDVNENLNVEYHTQFETDGAVVAGQSFDSFLRDTIEFRFVAWLLRQLPFEIRDTGHQNALSDLYDALPLIDRAELNGEASVEYTEEGQTKRSQETFDVVLRDRMGNPLVVANFNDSREAATEDDMRSLVTAATRVGESNESLSGAMCVTASFFEPGALETAAESTGGGLLSRDKRESFVKLSRKQGYHLCLVEARDEQFHMAVPEL